MSDKIISDTDCDDLEVQLYNCARNNIASGLSSDERVAMRNNIIKEWFKIMTNR